MKIVEIVHTEIYIVITVLNLKYLGFDCLNIPNLPKVS